MLPGDKNMFATSSVLKVALIQQSCCDGKQANLDKTAFLVRRAAASGAQLIVLQELHAGPYFCQSEDPVLFDLAEPIPGESSQFIARLARELGVVIVASFFERRAPGLCHNTAVVFEKDGEMAGIYRKMHIPDDPGYYEKYYFTPGDLGFNPVRTSLGTLGVLVCWDQWYPEAARLMALAGADLLIYPTAIGWEPAEAEEEKKRQRDAWMTVQRGHAIANGLPVLAANRVGLESSRQKPGAAIQFWGSSFAAGPQGEILAVAAADTEEVLIVDVNMARSETIRRIWPFLRDRRIDAYGDITRRYRD
jgi:N-carbamoylputrescine amidase